MFAEVQEVQRLSPSLIRVILGGGTLDAFDEPLATDAYINAQFLPADSPVTVPFDADDLDGVAAEHRPKPRRFTIRSWDADRRTMAIDFVAHGDVGYAGAWAQRVEPGDRLQFKGPGGSYRPSPDVTWHLMVGDESALGAIGASLESLPSNAKALVFVVVDGREHEIELPTVAEATVHWVHRYGSADPEAVLPDAIIAADFPAGSFDVFVHGEASETRAVRRHLLAERDVDASAASISPYWRRLHTDEDWRAVKRQFLAEQAADA